MHVMTKQGHQTTINEKSHHKKKKLHEVIKRMPSKKMRNYYKRKK